MASNNVMVISANVKVMDAPLTDSGMAQATALKKARDYGLKDAHVVSTFLRRGQLLAGVLIGSQAHLLSPPGFKW